jgi:L-fucose isomerase-like protein
MSGMSGVQEAKRFLQGRPQEFLRVPRARLQPILAKQGKPTIDLDKLRHALSPIAEVLPVIVVQSPEHWSRSVLDLRGDVDAILPVSIPAYPTEVWNSHPQALIERGLPVLFWPLMAYDEPDFWRWSARDFLRALGVEVYIARNARHGESIVRSLAVKRFLASSAVVVFGEQNFPWNAPAAGHLMTRSLGTRILVEPIEAIRSRMGRFTDDQVRQVWSQRQGRYTLGNVRTEALHEAVRVYLAIREILEQHKACAFGVNCFGDLVIRGGRDVPCLAQTLLREDGFLAACDGDFCAILSMMLITGLLDKPAMMSNMYPVRYVGALTDHFGDPLSPDPKRYPPSSWNNLARLAHCGFVGVISPEMTPQGKATLRDWGGTYEIKRDGRGCGIDADLVPDMPITVVEMCFDGRTLLLASARVCETTRHPNMPHCESSALLEFRNLEAFVESISREHTAVVYGDHIDELRTLAEVLKLDYKVF